MSGNEPPRTLSTAIPAIPLGNQPLPAGANEDEARARVAALDREARALGNSPNAALLFHEIGLLWESPLKQPRNAAMAYQSAFKLAPRFLANIRAARRLFAEVGNWMMVVTLIDAELQATEARRGKAALLLEKGLILENRLSKDADALAAMNQCLALEPEDVTLLVQLEHVFSEKGDYASLVKVYRLLAAAVAEDTARAHFFTTAGLLLEDRLKDVAGATALFREAFAIERRDPQLLAAMKRVAQREGTVDEELAALAAEAEGQGALAAPTFLLIAKAYERLGRPEDALAALLAARRVGPSDPLVLAELARIYEGQGRFEELSDVLLAWVNNVTDEGEFVSINFRLAALYEEQLHRDADAVARYRAILSRVPGHPPSLAGLGKRYFRSQNWAGLLETYEAEAAAADDARTKAGRMYKAAETLEERLGRVDEAIVRLNQCLQISPGYLPAQKALTRLYEKLGRWSELIGMYEADLMQTSDRELQITTLNKIAALYEDRLNDIPRAIESLRRVSDLSPDHLPTLRNLGRLYERAGQWNELLTLQQQESRLANDTKQVVSLAHRSAEILEEHLKDRPAAITAWERVLQLSPNYLPALRALGRLYDQDGRWESLGNMYRAEAEIASSTEQAAALIQRIGELSEHKLKNENAAIAAYREVLTLAPNHPPALRSLARIYRSQGSWENLIEILHAEAAGRTDPTERANAMFQAAAIWEDQLKNEARAIEGYQEVLRLAPSHSTALQQLERLLTAKDDLKELVVLLDRQTQAGPSSSRVNAWLKLARLYLDRLNEPPRAGSCCESALALEPMNLVALRLLERVRAGDKPRRAELRARIADALGDPKLSAALKLSGQELDPTATPSPELVEALKRASLADPTDEALGLVVERAMQRVGDAAGLVALYERRRATTTDSADMLQLWLRSADLLETRLGEPMRAIAAYQGALQASPDLYPALQGLVRCYLKLGDPVRARRVLESVATIARDQGTIAQALLSAAMIARDTLNDADGAAALLRQVLEREPLHPEAGPALEELLARRGGAADLALLREKRGDAKMAQKDAVAAAAEYFQAARIHLEGLKNRPAAVAALDRALMAMPTLPEALELKGLLALEEKNYAEAAAAFAVRVQQGGDPRHVSTIHLKLGALYHDHLGDHTRAAAHLQTALAGDPRSQEALERLAAIHTHSRNWTGAADCLRRLLELEQTAPARGRHTLALARIADEGFNDPGQAIALYRKALDSNPSDPGALDRLAHLYERTGSLPELVAMLEQQAHQTHDVRRVVTLKMRIAQIAAKNLEEPQRAIAAYRQVLELDPMHAPALVALADIFSRDHSSMAMAIETHRSLLKLDPARTESLHVLFKLWESMRQLDKAFCAAGLLVFLKAANELEQAFFNEARNRLSNDFRGTLASPDLIALHPPAARGPLADVFRAVGDQFVKLAPPQLEQAGIDRRADRLKPDTAIFKAIQSVSQLFTPDEFEVYQGKRGLMYLETTEPLAMVIGPDVVRRFNVREQRFLFGRASMGLTDKLAIVRKMSMPELADVVGNSIRIHQPAYEGLGRRNDEQTKALRKAYSRKALKLLEEPAAAAVSAPPVAIEALVQALLGTQDRAGLLVCADITAGLNLILREEAAPNAPRADSAEAVANAVHQRAELRELLTFAVSDDFFRLRQRIGVSLG